MNCIFQELEEVSSVDVLVLQFLIIVTQAKAVQERPAWWLGRQTASAGDLLRHLISLGFRTSDCITALSVNSGSLERAVRLVLAEHFDLLSHLTVGNLALQRRFTGFT